MKQSLSQLVIGGSGIAATEIVNQSANLSPDQITTAGNLIIQILIAVVTIFGLFKKKKP